MKVVASATSVHDCNVGKFVAFVYDLRWYIGCVTQISMDDNELKINSMHPHGPANAFRWPTRHDEVWVTADRLLCTIQCPSLKNSRGQYCLSGQSTEQINESWFSFKKNYNSEN